MRASESMGGRRRAAWILSLPFFLIGTACEESGDTIVVDGLDCGLVREDLFVPWTLAFVPVSALLINCDDPTYNNRLVDFDHPPPTTYTDVRAFASPSSVSFDVRGSGPDLNNELMATVEADSCLALVQKWENDDGGWVQCIGTLDRSVHAIPTLCDSMDLDTTVPPDGFPDVACDLDRRVTLQVFVP